MARLNVNGLDWVGFGKGWSFGGVAATMGKWAKKDVLEARGGHPLETVTGVSGRVA